MIFSTFQKFPDEAAYIGRILSAYTDLELGLMLCVNIVRGDFDAILKSMYRTRGETARIKIADALGRQSFNEIGLGNEFSTGIGAIRYSMKIRNQYAHCLWWDDYSGRLGFANLEEIANDNAKIPDFKSLTRYYVTAELLKSQEEYGFYVDHYLLWLNWEAQLRLGKVASHPHVMPAPQVQPDLHIP